MCARPARRKQVEDLAWIASADVCADHKAAMDGSDPWRWKANQDIPREGAILMGADLNSDGVTITRCLSWRSGRSRCRDESGAVGPHHRLGAVPHLQLGQDALDVGLDR